MPSRMEMQKIEERAWEDVHKGENIYEKLSPKLESNYKGQYIVINLHTGDYVVSVDEMALLDLADEKFGAETRKFSRKIGGPYPHLGFFGG